MQQKFEVAVNLEQDFTDAQKETARNNIGCTRIHRLACIGDDIIGETAPYGYWIIDLEKPNPNAPGGYDIALSSEIKRGIDNGDVFACFQYNSDNFKTIGWMTRYDDQSVQDFTAVRLNFERLAQYDDPRCQEYFSIYTPDMYGQRIDERIALLGTASGEHWWSVALVDEKTQTLKYSGSETFEKVVDASDVNHDYLTISFKIPQLARDNIRPYFATFNIRMTERTLGQTQDGTHVIAKLTTWTQGTGTVEFFTGSGLFTSLGGRENGLVGFSCAINLPSSLIDEDIELMLKFPLNTLHVGDIFDISIDSMLISSDMI